MSDEKNRELLDEMFAKDFPENLGPVPSHPMESYDTSAFEKLEEEVICTTMLPHKTTELDRMADELDELQRRNVEQFFVQLAEEITEDKENEFVAFMLDNHDTESLNGINMIAVCRKLMWHMMTEYNPGGDEADFAESFFNGYKANIAMVIFDQIDGADIDECNHTAEVILQRVFGS